MQNDDEIIFKGQSNLPQKLTWVKTEKSEKQIGEILKEIGRTIKEF